ncbi:phage tail tip lysozyme [Sinorhizobium fredii]|uniref:phage tail tip lysozyme n=1 Tax=Rhizobium fredii TaxID=380 RepID=UPI0004B0BB25|nr:phage tail tip lysozyme [Sinorhizobium fredii]AWM23447.1 Flagellar protein FlgJ [peptidoglycan hydrolase] [Sinorhizobium fredii CCBAU 25509]
MAYSFLFGGNTNETPESIRRKRELAMAIIGASGSPRNIGEGLNALGSGIVAGVMNRRADKAEKTGRSAATDLFNRIVGQAPNVSASNMLSPGVKPAVAGDVNMTGNEVYSGFMDTVDNTITNPFGLAAVAATGKAESGFSPDNANRTWSDPSQSGDPGTAGGVMSWRGPRLSALQAFAANKGEQGNGSPQTQAEFLLQEDPNLVTSLNNAKSTEEAQSLINNAWKFAGYNQSGGEPARRLGYANAFLPNFQGQGQPQQVASLDPSIGIPSPRPEPNAPAQSPVAAPAQPSLSDEVAEFEKTPEYAARFPGQNVGQQQAQPAQVPQPQQVAQAQPMQPQAPQGSDQMTILQALSNPFLNDEERAVLQTLYQQQVQAAAAQREEQMWRQRQDYERQAKQADPSYQLGLEKTRQEVEYLKTPEYQTLTAEERQALGIPDTDQRVYQRSRGGKIDAVGGAGQTINVGNEVDARKAAAQEIGLDPKDPRYQTFVLTGKMPREDAQALTATDKKAILEADEMVAANQSALDALSQAESLSDKANSGWFAGARASIGNNLPDWMVPDAVSSPESSQATTDMDNAIIGQAITQLKTIFGGNPTEGERNILLELQGSSTMPREVRKQVFSRARALAEKRLQFNNDRASDLRGGNYYKPDRAPATGQDIDDLLKKYGAP